MRTKIKHILVFFLIISMVSCANDLKSIEKPEVESISLDNNYHKNLNISLLLDLSDRIDPKKYPNESMDFYLRDVSYINSVSEAFYQHVSNKKVRQMKDRMQVFFDPEPLNKSINNMSENLKFSISRTNASVELLNEIKQFYSTKPKEIYELAINDSKFVGSDTWRFFKSRVKEFCIKDGYRNILILLTDGYIYHENTLFKDGNLTSYITAQSIRKFKLNTGSWNSRIEKEKFGFIPATTGLEQLEVFVIGINPDPKNQYDEDLLIRYWSDWFDSMGVGRYTIKPSGLPSNMDALIKDFILIQ